MPRSVAIAYHHGPAQVDAGPVLNARLREGILQNEANWHGASGSASPFTAARPWGFPGVSQWNGPNGHSWSDPLSATGVGMSKSTPPVTLPAYVVGMGDGRATIYGRHDDCDESARPWGVCVAGRAAVARNGRHSRRGTTHDTLLRHVARCL